MYKGIEDGVLTSKEEKEAEQAKSLKGLMALFPVIDRRPKECQETK